MSVMDYLVVHLLDLPNEMLVEIFKQFNSTDVLYSLVGVSRRLDRIAHDVVFTHFLDLTVKSSIGGRRPMPNIMLDRFCSYILPQIHHIVLEPLSMERILVCDYPKLHKLILGALRAEILMSYLEGAIFVDHNKQVFLNDSLIFM